MDSKATQHICHQYKGFVCYTKCNDQEVVHLGMTLYHTPYKDIVMLM